MASVPGAAVTATRMRSLVSHRTLRLVAPEVLEQLFFGFVGQEAQGQFPQGDQVVGAEEVGEGLGDLGLAGRCCRAASAGGAASGEESTSSIWSALRTTQSGTRSWTWAPVICSTASAMLSRCWMLTVVITSMPASRISRTSSQRLRVARSGHVGVGQLVDQGHLRMAGEHGVEVHLLEAGAPIVDDPPGDDLEVVAALLR